MRGKRTVVGLVVSLVVLLLIAEPVSALTYSEFGKPGLEATVDGSNVLAPGETAAIPITVQNTGGTVAEMNGPLDEFDQVVRAYSFTPGAAASTSVSVESADAPLEVRTGKQAIGTVDPDTRRTVPFRVEVAEDADPGTYRLPVTIEYQRVYRVIVNLNPVQESQEEVYVLRRTETVSRDVTVRVDTRARLEIVSIGADGLSERADGRLQATVRNAGTEPATDASLRMRETGALTPRSGPVGLDTLDPGETTDATFRVGVADSTSAGDHAVGLQLHYEDPNGVVRETPIRTGTVRVGSGPEFDTIGRAEALYVDSTGVVTLTVTNTGDAAARNARLHLDPSKRLAPITDSASLGRLPPGASATGRFKIEVSDRAVAGRYPITATVEHDDTFGGPVESDPLTVSVSVGPEASIETAGEPSIGAGQTAPIEFTVRNTGNATLHDAVVRLNADSPFETDDDTTYVGDLSPGESTTVTFTVSVDSAATPKRYALDTTVKYDNPFDRRVVTDVEPTAIRVTDRDGGVLGWLRSLL